MEFDFSLITNSLPLLLQGALVTLEITAMAVGLGLVFGLLAALAQLSKFTPLRLLAKIYVDFIRGTPLLVQIFIIYFALPAIIGQRIDPFVAAVAACSINSGAYVAEIFRAGIQSIEVGQMRAGLSLGMTWGQTMRYIILPQAFKRIIPPLGNEFIAMLKDSSLVSVIGFEELTRTGQLIIAETYGSLEIWTSVAIIYLVMTLTITAWFPAWKRSSRQATPADPNLDNRSSKNASAVRHFSYPYNLESRHGSQKRLRICVLRMREDILGRTAFDNAAALHHRHFMRHKFDHGKVVRDEQVRHALLGLDLPQQIENLRLHRNIQCGSRLIADHDFRLNGQRSGNGNALTLPAGKFVRQTIGRSAWKPHAVEKFAHFPTRIRFG